MTQTENCNYIWLLTFTFSTLKPERNRVGLEPRSAERLFSGSWSLTTVCIGFVEQQPNFLYITPALRHIVEYCQERRVKLFTCGVCELVQTTIAVVVVAELTQPSHDPHMILTWPSHDPQLYKITVYSFLDLADQMGRRCFMPRRRRTRMCLCCTSIFSTERTTSRSRRVPGWWIRMLCSCESLVTRGNHQVLV